MLLSILLANTQWVSRQGFFQPVAGLPFPHSNSGLPRHVELLRSAFGANGHDDAKQQFSLTRCRLPKCRPCCRPPFGVGPHDTCLPNWQVTLHTLLAPGVPWQSITSTYAQLVFPAVLAYKSGMLSGGDSQHAVWQRCCVTSKGPKPL